MNPGRRYLDWIFIGLGPLMAGLVATFLDLDPQNPMVTHMAAIALWVALWWITEAVPLAVTALLPVVLFPFMGIMPADAVAGLYFNTIIFLFIGGFLIAIAMERWQLHKRIALVIINGIGVSPRRLILGFMLATGFISMWMSNTATTMMIFPIALSVVLKLEERGQSERLSRFSAGLLMSVAYASSIGGFATLIGTPPNLSFVRKMAIYFPQAPEMSFTQWMLFAAPLSLIMLLGAWWVLTRLFCAPPKAGESAGLVEDALVFESQYRELGPMSREEILVLAVFLLTVVLWMTRSDIMLGGLTIPGWADLFRFRNTQGDLVNFVDDGTVAVLMALLLFLLPAATMTDAQGKRIERNRILRWEDTLRLPWGVVLIFGGGFALASGVKDSGLSLWMGEQLSAMKHWDPVLMVGLISAFMVVLSEFMSNIAAVEMVLPILASTAMVMGINPLLIMVPATIAASFGFMLPIATAPNTIVFGSNRIRVEQMAQAGFFLNLLGIILVTVFIFLVGLPVFHIELGKVPTWAQAAAPR